MRLESSCEPVFARHETFHPRYGWVKKSVDAASGGPDVFASEDAVLVLGVGKNMVQSIRFWGLAYGVLALDKVEGVRLPSVVPTPIGRAIFSDGGWDPYCEFSGTAWLLHWLLLSPPSLVPVWWLAFNEYSGVEFTDVQLLQFMFDRLRDWTPQPSSVNKDLACLLRMYTNGVPARATFDDIIDCPSRDLGLITSAPTRGLYRFAIGPKPTLPAAIAAFACLDFMCRTDPGAKTATVSRLSNEPGSPGRAFKLTEAALLGLLETAAQTSKQLEVTTAVGVPQLAISGDPSQTGTRLLRMYYEKSTGHTLPAHSGAICGLSGVAPSAPITAGNSRTTK